MNETRPSSPFVARRNPQPTPPPAATTPAEESPPDSSSDDPLAALLAAEEQGEAWIVLNHDSVMRASEIRRIKVAGHEEQDMNENGQPIRARWPVPNLEVNGELISCPTWTLAELIRQIGVDVIESPTKGRKWERVKPQTKI